MLELGTVRSENNDLSQVLNTTFRLFIGYVFFFNL